MPLLNSPTKKTIQAIVFAGIVSLTCLLKPCLAGLGPGARTGACTAVYNNTIYVWGGQVNFPSANFTSTTLPISIGGSIVWNDLSWDIPPNLANNSTQIPTWPCVVSPDG